MKIAFVHYHLRPGGVTQVIKNQTAALREAGEEILVLSGEAPANLEDYKGISVSVVPLLHYDRYRQAEPEINPVPKEEELAFRTEEAIRSHWPGGADLLHVHNPLIRKNSSLIGALKKLSERMPLLLQNHDLAEDFRPDVYTGEEYPADCHYAVINKRDYRFLLEAGLKPEGLHFLPNEVQKLSITPGLARTRFMYPVRGIRRKNIGETLFLSLFTGSLFNPKQAETKIAITQPPTTEQDMPIYSRWKEIAAKLNLPVEFEAGLNSSFADVMGSARAVITTSVKEGFGFSFLEPWTAFLPVAGRRIDYVCRDFEEAGLRLDHLYPSLNIPAEYAEPEKILGKTAEALSRLYASFSLPLPPHIQNDLRTIFSRDLIDFGIMDEEIQKKIINLAVKDKAVREHIKKENPFLEIIAESHFDPGLIKLNREAVLSAYSSSTILKTIMDAYRKALFPVSQNIERSKLLELYLDPARLFLTGISP